MKKVLASLLLLAGLCAQAKPTVFPVSLSCNDMVDPVAVSDVSFSWKLPFGCEGGPSDCL